MICEFNIADGNCSYKVDLFGSTDKSIVIFRIYHFAN